MRDWVRQHAVLSFTLLAYSFSWLAWTPLLTHDVRVTPGGSVTHFPGLLGPALAAFVVALFVDGATGGHQLTRRILKVSRPTFSFFAYSLSPLVFLVLALGVLVVLRRPLPTPSDFGVYSGLPLLSLPVVVLLVFPINGFGEETGWRGFALARLQERYGPVRGTLVLALIWAGWHIPMFWFVEGYRAWGIVGLVGGFGLGIVAGAIVLARVVNRTDGSILAAALWHSTYNMTAATAASRGIVGAVTTTCVMLWACILLLSEWRRPLARSRLLVARAA
jgi:uncharacterized protein